MKRLLLLLPVLLVVLTSGCTMPELPGGIQLPFFSTGATYESDIIIVKDLSAIPSSVRAGENVRLVAYIENMGDDAVPQKSIGLDEKLKDEDVVVQLYDHCEGLFQKSGISVSCPSGVPGADNTNCTFSKILAGETMVVDWTLKAAKDVKLETPCEFKVYVRYPYTTDGLTTLSFISQNEYKRQLEAGTFKTKSHYTTKGQGPVKAYFTVNDQEPIPAASPGTDSYTSVSLDIHNMGYGFLADPTSGKTGTKGPRIIKESFNLTIPGDTPIDAGNCELTEKDGHYVPNEDVKLIKDKRSLPCSLKIPADINKEATFQLNARVSYLYEFRKTAKVTVSPV